jgi:hypothetical protein
LALPSWGSFDVASYSAFQSAVSGLQNSVLFDNSHIVPVLLATTASSPFDGTESALATAYALEQIESGNTLDIAKNGLGSTPSEQKLNAVTSTYATLGIDSNSRPDEDQKAQARDQLESMNIPPIKKPWYKHF